MRRTMIRPRTQMFPRSSTNEDPQGRGPARPKKAGPSQPSFHSSRPNPGFYHPNRLTRLYNVAVEKAEFDLYPKPSSKERPDLQLAIGTTIYDNDTWEALNASASSGMEEDDYTVRNVLRLKRSIPGVRIILAAQRQQTTLLVRLQHYGKLFTHDPQASYAPAFCLQ